MKVEKFLFQVSFKRRTNGEEKFKKEKGTEPLILFHFIFYMYKYCWAIGQK